ncbi:MAG: RNA-binding cell elongation regulator Jag/EloR [Thermodesulfobacteriota bacterium]
MAWQEFSGKTVKDAIEKACGALRTEEAFLHIEVLQEGTKGFLGIVGHKEALIKVRKRDLLAEVMRAQAPAEPPEEIPTAEPEEDLAAEARTEGEEDFADSGEEAPQIAQQPVQEDSPRIAEAKSALEEILRRMEIEALVNASVVDGAIYLDIKGDGSGLLIGKKGQTLDALQYLVSKIVNRENGPKERVEVIVDTENYRLRKRENLRDIATRMSQRAKKTLKPVSLSPMPANERRIVHMILAEDREVYTKSYGEGPMRRIIVYPRRGTVNKRRRR